MTSTPGESTYPTRKLSTDTRPFGEELDTPRGELQPRLRRMVADGKERVTEWRGDVEDGIREKPILTVLIAAAVGAAFGVVLGRRV
jgi:ElaB/YqjD/DUF883 family membrane-anchored ribosome-binding protein